VGKEREGKVERKTREEKSGRERVGRGRIEQMCKFIYKVLVLEPHQGRLMPLFYMQTYTRLTLLP